MTALAGRDGERPASQVARLAPALAVAISALAFGRSADLGTAGALLALPALLAWAVQPRVRIDEFGQGVGTLVAVIVALLVNALVHQGEPFTRQVLGGCALTCIAIGTFRIAQPNPRYGQRGTLGIALIPMVVAGAMPATTAYVAGAVAIGLLGLAILRFDDASEPVLARLSRRRALAWGVLLALVTVTTAALVAGLPGAQRWALARMSFDSRSWTGFGRQLALGSLNRIMESERLMLRIHRTDPAPATVAIDDAYLRGVVYTWFRDGQWLSDDSSRQAIRALPAVAVGTPGWIQVERVAGGGREYLAPLGVGAISSAQPELERTPSGLLFAARERSAWYGWRTAGQQPAALAAPGADERHVPVELASMLARWLAQHGPAPADPAARVAHIRRVLQRDYRYALVHDHVVATEPLEDFLFHHREGHCEFFATAMTLLARAHGVPARLVGGYFVTEHNPWGGFRVARERDAHAWTEVWLDGAWRTVDATPPGAVDRVVRHEVATARLLVEYVTGVAARLWAGLGERELYALVLLLGAVLAVLRYRALRVLRRGGAGGSERTPALPCFQRVAAALARRGLERRSGETLAAFARRIEASGLARAGELAAWIGAYAAWRYGGEGSDAMLDVQARALLRDGL